MALHALRGRPVDAVAPPSHARRTLADFYRDHFDFVRRVARRLAGRALDVDDVAQEVFLVVARRLDTFEPMVQETTWLYAITLNVVRAMRRRLRLELSHRADETAGLDVPLLTHDAIELREAFDELNAVLGAMSPRKRDVFVLAEFEGMTCAEIAALVGTREATVWSRLHYARREFADRLARRARRR